MLVQFATSTVVRRSGLALRGRLPGPVFRVLGSRQRRELREVRELLDDRVGVEMTSCLCLPLPLPPATSCCLYPLPPEYFGRQPIAEQI